MIKPTQLLTDTTKTIYHSAFLFFSGTALSRISGLLRDICLAYAFGTQSAVAALLVAFRFSHLLRRVLGEGAMQTAFIPHFENLRKENPKQAGIFFKDLAISLIHLLSILVLLTMGGLGILLKWGHLDEGNQEILWLTFLMMPSLLFICLFGINAALMQCEKYYFVSSLAPVAFNVVWIAGILVSSHLPLSQAMTSLSFFVIGACFLQWAATLPSVYRILKNFGVSALWKNSKLYSPTVLQLGKPLALGIMGMAAAQINNALDAVFARWAESEGPAFLWYSIRIQQLPLALFGIAIANALLPPLSRAAKTQNNFQFFQFLEFAVQRTLKFIFPITILLFLLGDQSIQLIYGHGDFTFTSVLGTTFALWGYALGLIPMALVLILAPSFYAQGDYQTPAKASLASVCLNISGNWLMIAIFEQGAASVAIATSISAWFNCLWLGFYLKNVPASFFKNLWPSMLKIIFATLCATIALIIFQSSVWQNFSAWEIWKGTTLNKSSVFQQMIQLSTNFLIFVSFFLLVLKVSELNFRNKVFSKN